MKSGGESRALLCSDVSDASIHMLYRLTVILEGFMWSHRNKTVLIASPVCTNRPILATRHL